MAGPGKVIKKTSLPPPPDSLSDDPASDRDREADILIDGLDEEIDQPDPWSALWETGDGKDQITVQLIRLTPDSMIDQGTGQSVQLSGYVSDLPPGLDSYEGWIKANFGGGRYQAVKRVRGKFARRLTVTIAGVPISQTSVQTKGIGAPAVADSSEVAVEEDERYRNVSLSGNEAQFEKRLERMAFIAKLFPPPPADLSTILLQHVLNQPPSGGLSGLKDTVEALALLKETVGIGGGEGGESSGGDWLDIIKAGISAFSEAVRASRPVSSPGRGQVHPQADVRLLTDKSQGAAGTASPENKETETMPQPTTQQLVQAAIGTIGRGFLLDPPMLCDDVIDVLDDTLGLPASYRAGLKPFKGRLYNQARLALSEDFQDNPEIQKEFKVYFDTVFDGYTAPERIAVTMP